MDQLVTMTATEDLREHGVDVLELRAHGTPPAETPALTPPSVDTMLDRMIELAREFGYREAQYTTVQDRIDELERNLADLNSAIARIQAEQVTETAGAVDDSGMAAARAGADTQPDTGFVALVVDAASASPSQSMRRARFTRIRLKVPPPAPLAPAGVSDVIEDAMLRRARWVRVRPRLSDASA